MDDNLIPLFAIVALFIGLPWLIFHYITKWKTAATLTSGDEKLLDDLHDAENPNWRQQCLPGREREESRRLLADGE
jgi:phage shock protein B